MKTTLSNKVRLVIALCLIVLTACAQKIQPQAKSELRGMGMIVDSRLAKGMSKKLGVNAVTDAGMEIFSFASLSQTGGGVSSIGGGRRRRFLAGFG